jgi:PAS domain S-box-containing protein
MTPAFKATSSELTDFFENAAIGLQSIGPDGVILWANQALLDLLGYSRAEYVGHSIRQFHADGQVVRRFMERLTAGETLRDFEAPLHCKDGATRHVLIDANVYREHDRFVHTRCFVRDVTERKRLEDELARHVRELAEADRCKDEFLANLSHELRTPLNALLGWARLLRSGRLDPAKREQAIATIERNAVAQAKLIEDLLDVSRIVSGKLTLETRPLDLSPLVRAVVENEGNAAEQKNLQLTFVPDGAGPIIVGDPHRLEQVVWNLISNAIKFTPEGGHVEVRVDHDEEHARILVSDDGRGISASFLPFVFERFRQSDGTFKRGQSGLGLGLAIVRDLIALHGGTVAVASEGEGTGARFTVTLPLAALSMNPSGLRSGAGGSGAPTRTRLLMGISVLLVDDQSDARDLMSLVLENHGAVVASVASVSEALEVLSEVKPDVLVSDIGLPLLDGYDLIRRVRSLPAHEGGAIRAVALTAYAHAEDRRRALRAGFDLHLGKPVEPDELVSCVATLSNDLGRVETCEIESPGA